MKKTLLSIALITGIVGASDAQNQANHSSKVPSSLANTAVPYTKKVMVGNEPMNGTFDLNTKKAGANSPNGTTIGTTWYDLQTNSSIQPRMWAFSNGSRVATFTYAGTSTSAAAPDRGTGYVLRTGNAWSNAPTSRIESQRTGWPTYGALGNGGEFILAHNTSNDALTSNRRATFGTGSWVENLATTDPTRIMLWNRFAVGGTNNNTIHMIAITAPSGNGGTAYQGLDGALLYYRSTNGGLSWDISELLVPGISSAEFSGFGGDTYAIHARGNTVAFAAFNTFSTSFMMKSDDNGSTWTRHDFLTTGLGAYDPAAANSVSDVNGDGVADTIPSTDNCGSIVIDHNGKAHIFFGLMRYLDDDPQVPAAGEGSFSFFPATDGLYYWNEDRETNEYNLIAQAQDLDNNGVIDIIGGSINGIARYFSSLTSFPHAGVDINNNIYVVYNSFMENLNNGVQHYRHSFIKKSTDGGCSWSEGLNFTGNSNFSECVFATMYPEVTDSVYVIFQEDNIPGLAVRGEEHAFVSNDIVYTSIGVSEIPSTSEFCFSKMEANGNPTFCAGDSVLLTAAGCGISYSWNTGSTDPEIWVSQFGTYNVDITTGCGIQSHDIIIDAPSGNISFNLVAEDNAICPGDSTVLEVRGVSIGSAGSYAWSNGATTASITVVQVPGGSSFDVTVTNCQGTADQTIAVNIPTTVAAQITTNVEDICDNETLDVEGAEVSAGSYEWRLAGNVISNSSSVQISQPGSYEYWVENCVGRDSIIRVVSTTQLPNVVASVLGSSEICEGQGSIILSASGAENYQWFKDNSQVPGGNLASLALTFASQSGDYYVSGENRCGEDANSSTLSVTINETPATPVIDYQNGVFTATGTVAANYVWFIDGNPIGGQNNQTWAPPGGAVNGRQVSVRAIGANGCESAVSSSVLSVNKLSIGSDEISVYPNPAKQQLNIAFNGAFTSEKLTVKIFNIVGQEVMNLWTVAENNSLLSLDVSSLSSGIYVLNISNSEESISQKLIIE